jgi:Ca2+/Na+ antiporter
MFYRDAIVYLLTLAILAFFLRDRMIDIFEALILCCMWPTYIYITSLFSTGNPVEKEIEDEESNKLIEEGKLVRSPDILRGKRYLQCLSSELDQETGMVLNTKVKKSEIIISNNKNLI